VSQQTYLRWKKDYGGAKDGTMKRLKQRESENKQLKKAVADMTLEKRVSWRVAQDSAPIWPPASLAQRQAEPSCSKFGEHKCPRTNEGAPNP
jgi:hypothetical protein